MLKKSIFFILVLALFSCESESGLEQKIEKIPVEVKVLRFDQKFAEAETSDFPQLKKDFPFLFPKNTPDSVWIKKMNDTLQQDLNREVAKAFPDLDPEKYEIRRLFQHLKYYFPKFDEPKVVTLTTNVDYRNRVIVTDSLLLLSLDVYLGKDHKFYGSIYKYIRKDFEPELLVSDIATEYAKNFVPYPESDSFLAQMVYYGKILYLKDLLIPFKSDAQKIRYTGEELVWAQKNEVNIWRFFVENELLFKTDPDLRSRFIDIAPFSKFRLQLDSESPPQIGRYIGWQIVRQAVERNENIPLKKVLEMEAGVVFDKSNYKPEKE